MCDAGGQVGGEETPELRIEELDRTLLDGVTGDGGRRVRADVGLIPVFLDERPLLGLAGLIDWRISGRLSQLVRAGMCSGRSDDALLMPGQLGLPADRLILVGVGLREDFDESRAIATAERLVEMAFDLRARDVLIAVPALSEERDGLEALCVGIDRELARRWRELEEAREARAEPAANETEVDGEKEADLEVEAEPDPEFAEEDAADPDADEKGVAEEVSDGEPTEAGGEDSPSGDPTVVRRTWDPPDGQGSPWPGADGESDGAVAASGEPTILADPAPGPRMPGPWWIAAEPHVVVRLRSLLGGSLRAAEPGSGSSRE